MLIEVDLQKEIDFTHLKSAYRYLITFIVTYVDLNRAVEVMFMATHGNRWLFNKSERIGNGLTILV